MRGNQRAAGLSSENKGASGRSFWEAKAKGKVTSTGERAQRCKAGWDGGTTEWRSVLRARRRMAG